VGGRAVGVAGRALRTADGWSTGSVWVFTGMPRCRRICSLASISVCARWHAARRVAS
jgi:hypothetical protein